MMLMFVVGVGVGCVEEDVMIRKKAQRGNGKSDGSPKDINDEFVVRCVRSVWKPKIDRLKVGEGGKRETG